MSTNMSNTLYMLELDPNIIMLSCLRPITCNFCYDMVCKEVSNAIKCGTMMGILINNIIWIDKHGPHLELFNGPTYKWSLHTQWLTLLTITRRMKKNALTHRILLLTWNNCYLNMDILQAISFILKCGVKYVAIVSQHGYITSNFIHSKVWGEIRCHCRTSWLCYTL